MSTVSIVIEVYLNQVFSVFLVVFTSLAEAPHDVSYFWRSVPYLICENYNLIRLYLWKE